MKTNKQFLTGILAMALVFGMAVAGCDNGGGGGDNSGNGGNGGGGGSAFLGDTLALSGQVYLMTANQSTGNYSYQNFSGSLVISDNGGGGSGAITNGQLTYSIGIPSKLEKPDMDFNDGDDDMWDNLSFSNQNVKGFELGGLSITNSTSYDYLLRGNLSVSGNSTSGSGTNEMVMYMYVDGDLTITGKGKTTTTTTDSGITSTEKWTTQNLNLALKKGWNAVYMKQTWTGTSTPTTSTMNITATVSLSNPSNLKWILEEDYSYSGSAAPPLKKQTLSGAPAASGIFSRKAFDLIRQRIGGVKRGVK